MIIAPSLALAETQVRGNPDAVSVEAQNASVEEILVALANTFDVQFRSSADLERRLTGNYQGSLQEVVMHVLAGFDFFVKSGEKGLEITLVGASSERPAPVASSGGPIPTKVLTEGPHPMPSPPGSAPSPVPGPPLSSAPLPSPAAPGSTAPVSERGSRAVPPLPVAGTTPFSAPRPAR